MSDFVSGFWNAYVVVIALVSILACAVLLYMQGKAKFTPGKTMGHAGAIIGGADDTAAAKMKIMKECGIHVVESPAEIGETMAKVLGKK